MRAAFRIARKDITLRVRDRSAFIWGIIAPLGLAIVFSLLLGGVTGSDSLDVTYAVADEDGGEVAQGFVGALVQLDAEGVFSIEERFERVQYKMLGTPFGDMLFDTQAKEDPKGPLGAQLGGILRAMVAPEAVFQFKVNARGETSDIVVPESIKKMLSTPGMQQMGEMGMSIPRALGQAEFAMRDATQALGPRLPPDPAARPHRRRPRGRR